MNQIMNGKDNHGNTPTAPEGWTPEYDFTTDPETGDTIPDESTVIEHIGPSIVRPGFHILQSWTEDDGFLFFIDHDRDAPFTLEELRDLHRTLGTILEEHQD